MIFRRFPHEKIRLDRRAGHYLRRNGFPAGAAGQTKKTAGDWLVGWFPARFSFTRLGHHLEDRPAIGAVGYVYPHRYAAAHEEETGQQRKEYRLFRRRDVLHHRRAAHGRRAEGRAHVICQRRRQGIPGYAFRDGHVLQVAGIWRNDRRLFQRAPVASEGDGQRGRPRFSSDQALSAIV